MTFTEPHVDPDCLFCCIVDGSTPSEVVYADDHVVGFLDIRPLFHGHTLVVPRRHAVTLADLRADELEPFFSAVQHLSARIPDACDAQGTFVANNNVVSQSVAHLHYHVVPRTKGDGLRGFFWPRTKYGPGEIESVGEALRTALIRAPE